MTAPELGTAPGPGAYRQGTAGALRVPGRGRGNHLVRGLEIEARDDSEQFLFITEGRGIVATKDKESVVTPGTVVYIPAGEVHWHGATDVSSMTHLNIQKAGIHKAE